jgi:Outer membrane protein beta-barrel domain
MVLATNPCERTLHGERQLPAMRRAIGLLVAAAFSALPAQAQEPAGSGPVASRGVAWSFGSFQPATSEPNSTGRGYALGIAAQLQRPSGLRYALEMTLYGANYATPAGLNCGLFCSVDREMSLTVLGVGAGIAHGLRLGAADLYAGAGAGLYFSTLEARQFAFGLPADGIKERDLDVGVDLRAGVLFDLGERSGLGIEYRRLWLRGDFGVLSNGGSMPIGGEFVQGIYRKTF